MELQPAFLVQNCEFLLKENLQKTDAGMQNLYGEDFVE